MTRTAFAAFTRSKSRMSRKLEYGSVRGAPGNGRPYREPNSLLTSPRWAGILLGTDIIAFG